MEMPEKRRNIRILTFQKKAKNPKNFNLSTFPQGRPLGILGLIHLSEKSQESGGFFIGEKLQTKTRGKGVTLANYGTEFEVASIKLGRIISVNTTNKPRNFGFGFLPICFTT